ncbi:RNA polymerase subunit [Eptesipox virus]|uniref:DNA-directed RNA polymerase 18 kDa subunit n=1 Tax=Eptesipox virus TaxID=1329402 RepID=A0A220T6F2_9POXV|nr:RNA polymerase subunit [Eptesipox virus]ASK51290.1 RNA polymerase subunit [Eptesipox virus]WAH71048.1 RNA polymerase subunit [Eptesipox virus]
MSTFIKHVYLPITLDPHELTLDIIPNIKNAILKTYLHRESGGIMAKKIDICKDSELPLGELINNHILINVPCEVTYKYYKNGDIVQGTINIEDENNVTVVCGDLICKLGKDSGSISFSDSKYCFIRNTKVYENGTNVTAILKEQQQGMDSYFIFLGSLIEEPTKSENATN